MTHEILARNLIHRQTWLDKSGQSIKMESFWKVGELALHVEIIRNTYDFQSSAVIYKMTPNGWKPVASIPFPNMASLALSVGDRRTMNSESLNLYAVETMMQDESKLLELALAILL